MALVTAFQEHLIGVNTLYASSNKKSKSCILQFQRNIIPYFNSRTKGKIKDRFRGKNETQVLMYLFHIKKKKQKP